VGRSSARPPPGATTFGPSAGLANEQQYGKKHRAVASSTPIRLNSAGERRRAAEQEVLGQQERQTVGRAQSP